MAARSVSPAWSRASSRRHAGQVVSREMLAREVWKEPARSTSLDNVIDVHMTHLRRTIDTDRPPLIHTVRGVAFSLREDN